MNEKPTLASIDLSQLGLRIEAARIAAGLSVAQAARLSGIFVRTINDWEAGKERVSPLSFSKLNEIYGVTPDDIFALPLIFENDDAAVTAYRYGRLSGAEFMRWMALDHVYVRLWKERRVQLECPHCYSDIFKLRDEPLGDCWRCGIALVDPDKASFSRVVYS
jgi:transcriptional regulator with XRE-family HTH domain